MIPSSKEQFFMFFFQYGLLLHLSFNIMLKGLSFNIMLKGMSAGHKIKLNSYFISF